MAKLYLIPTPVGNLEDITLRALRLLKEVSVILAEDTRTSAKLLKHYDINTPLLLASQVQRTPASEKSSGTDPTGRRYSSH